MTDQKLVFKKQELIERERIENMVEVLQERNRKLMDSEEQSKYFAVRMVASLLEENLEMIVEVQDKLMIELAMEKASKESNDPAIQMEIARKLLDTEA
mgnify:CR=1 FL=1